VLEGHFVASKEVYNCVLLVLLSCFLLKRNVRFLRFVCVFDAQNIDGIPDSVKKLYKTVWEISQKTIIKMAADRGAFIDQSQSLNLHFAEPDKNKLNSAHFYAWKMVCVCLVCHVTGMWMVEIGRS